MLHLVTIVSRAWRILTARRLANPQTLSRLLRRAVRTRLHVVRAALLLLLLAALALAACGGGARTSREPGAPGKIEALREAQERAQQKIEAEGNAHLREAQREQEAARREAEREAGGG